MFLRVVGSVLQPSEHILRCRAPFSGGGDVAFCVAGRGSSGGCRLCCDAGVGAVSDSGGAGHWGGRWGVHAVASA